MKVYYPLLSVIDILDLSIDIKDFGKLDSKPLYNRYSNKKDNKLKVVVAATAPQACILLD